MEAIGQGCLDRFIVFGQEHPDYVRRDYVEHYHMERPHQAIENQPLMGSTPAPSNTGEVVFRARLGGVLRHYARAAA